MLETGQANDMELQDEECEVVEVSGDSGQQSVAAKGYRGPDRRKKRAPRSHLTIRELAARWGVSPNFVRRLVWDGKLAGTRFGRAVRIPLQAVEEFALRNTRGTGACEHG